MGGTNCKECDRKLPKSTESYDQKMEWVDGEVTVRNHNNGQYYCIKKVNLGKAFGYGMALGLVPFLALSSSLTYEAITDDTYYCSDCFKKLKKGIEQMQKQGVDKQENGKSKQNQRQHSKGRVEQQHVKKLDATNRQAKLEEMKEWSRNVQEKMDRKRMERKAQRLNKQHSRNEHMKKLDAADQLAEEEKRRDKREQADQWSRELKEKLERQERERKEEEAKTHLELEQMLTRGNLKCSPLVYAQHVDRNCQLSLCCKFVEREFDWQAQTMDEVEDEKGIDGGSNSLLGDAVTNASGEAHKEGASLHFHHEYDKHHASNQLAANHEELLDLVLNMQDSNEDIDREWLTEVQTYFFICCTKRASHTDILIDALSSVSSSLNDQEYLKLTKAFASICKEVGDIAFSGSEELNQFLGGLVCGCLQEDFTVGSCITQCIRMYLRTCQEGVHYDEELLQMVAPEVEASLWFVFAAVAIRHQGFQVELCMLKEYVHLIQTYQIPQYAVEEAVSKCYSSASTSPLESLKEYKNRPEKSLETVMDEIASSKHLSRELCDSIKECVKDVPTSMDIETCNKYLTDDRKAQAKEALMKLGNGVQLKEISMALTFISCAIYKCQGYMPRTTQLVSVCVLLSSAEYQINRLLEVATGEGKSCIIAMFAAALGLQEKKVDIITSSPVLARRDAKQWREFFDIFDLKVDDNTETPDLLVLGPSEGDKKRAKCYEKCIVYGTVSSFSADILREEFEMREIRSGRGFQAAIVDEVDMLMLDEGVQFTYLSHRAAVLRHIEPVLAMVWSAVQTNTLVLTANDSIFFAGVAKYFHDVIFDCIDPSQHAVENPTNLLFRLLEDEDQEIEKVQHTVRQFLHSEDAAAKKEVIEKFETEELILLINCLNKREACNIVAYSPNKHNLLEVVVGQEHVDQNSVLIVGKGMLCPLYMEHELKSGIQSMVLDQCNIQDSSEMATEEGLCTEDGQIYFPGIPEYFDEVVSKFLDPTQLLFLAAKFNVVEERSIKKFMENDDDESRKKAFENLGVRDMIKLLRNLEEHLQCKFSAYRLNADNLLEPLDAGSSQKHSRLHESRNEIHILVMEHGMISLLTPEDEELPTEGSPDGSCSSKLCSTDGRNFSQGITDLFQIVLLKCLNPAKLLCLLMKLEGQDQNILNLFVNSEEDEFNFEENMIIKALYQAEKYLSSNLVVYAQKNETNQLIHRPKQDKDEDHSQRRKIPILLMDKGMICQLHVKEIVEIPSSLREFITNQLPTYIGSAFTALKMQENREYLLKGGSIVPVDFQNSGIIETNKRWGGGLQQMLEMKHHLPISDMSVITNFMSHVEFFQRYTRDRDEATLYGLSGTVGLQSDTDILRELYKLYVCKIPTYLHKIHYEKEPVFVEGSRHSWLNKIQQVLEDVIDPKPYLRDTSGGAGLVLCEDISTADEVAKHLRDNGKFKVTLYTRNDTENKVSVERKDGFGSREIIVATNLAGRGTDIKVQKEVNECGGLFCLMTFLPRNRRVELQAFGRTARSGQPGCVQYVLQASSLPCEYHPRLSLTNIREYLAKEEKWRLEEMIKTDIKRVQVREILFREHCDFLKQVHDDIDSRKDKQLIIDSINENWGQFLQMKEHVIGELHQEELIKELQAEHEKWRPPAHESPDAVLRLTKSNFHHMVKFGNQIIRGNRESAARVDDLPLNNLIKLGRRLFTDEVANAKRAIEYYTEAIEMESKFTMIAYYNRAYCWLCLSKDDMVKAINDLKRAKELLHYYTDEVSIVSQCAMIGGQKESTEDSVSSNSTEQEVLRSESATKKLENSEESTKKNQLLQQMEVRMQVLQFFGTQIDETLKKLTDFQKSGVKVEAIPKSILQFIPEADLVTNEELYGLSFLGLEVTFSVKKRPTFCWQGAVVFALGVAQIAVGVCLSVLSVGTLSSIGMGLIAEGVSDCIDGVIGMVTGEWDWKEWGISKSCSIGLSIACGGVGKFIQKGAKALRYGVKGLREAQLLSSVAQKSKTVITDVKSFGKVAKGSWGTTLKTNVKNTGKLVGKELVQQGSMRILSKVENEAIEMVFKRIGDRFAEEYAQPHLKEVFFSTSGTDESCVEIMIDCMLVPKLPDSYLSMKEMSPVDKERKRQCLDSAREYFSSIADEVVNSLVPKSSTFDTVATHIRDDLLPQISEHLKGKAAVVAGFVKVSFVTSSINTVLSQLECLIEKFRPEMEAISSQRCQTVKTPPKADGGRALEPIKEFKNQLAEHTAKQLGKAVSLVLQQNLAWMANHGLSKSVNKLASHHLSMGLGMEETKEKIRAGQAKNYLHSGSSGGGRKLSDHEVHTMKEHCKRISDPSNPGTLAELRVAAETYGCKVVVLNKADNSRNCSIDPPHDGVKNKDRPVITLIHTPPDKCPPHGHYEVQIDGKPVSVKAKAEDNSCMYDAFAAGLKSAKTPDSSTSTKDLPVDGQAVRNAVSSQVSKHPEVWFDHYKRKETLERMRHRNGEEFLLRGAAPTDRKKCINDGTYSVEINKLQPGLGWMATVTYKQENMQSYEGKMFFDSKGVYGMQMTVKEAQFTSGRCAIHGPSFGQLQHRQGTRTDHSFPVSAHMVGSYVGGCAGIATGNSFVSSDHYNKEEQRLSFPKLESYGRNEAFNFKVCVEFEPLVPRDINEFVRDLNNERDRRRKSFEGELRNSGLTRRERETIEKQMALCAPFPIKHAQALKKRLELIAQKAPMLKRAASVKYVDESGNVIIAEQGRDLELYVHQGLQTKKQAEFNNDISGAELTRTTIWNELQTLFA